MQNSIEIILQQTKGIMLFDLSAIDDPSNNQFNKQLYHDVKTAIYKGMLGK